MRRLIAPLFVIFSLFTLSACSVFGGISVKVAPYKVIEADGAFEIRHYERLVLVSTNMPDGMGSASAPFYKLFDYISGNNDKTEKNRNDGTCIYGPGRADNRSNVFCPACGLISVNGAISLRPDRRPHGTQ
jgi:hypothetical protein